MSWTKPRLLITATVVAVLATGGGVALAASGGKPKVPDDAHRIYNACVDYSHGGSVRLVAYDAKCRSGEQHISWNKQGVSGPAGARGAAGVSGKPGTPGASGSAGPSGAAGAQGAMGQPGANGSQGSPGTNGTDGTNASVSTKAAPTSACANGGVEIDTATGTTTNTPAYVCNGAPATGKTYFAYYDGISVSRSSPGAVDGSVTPQGGVVQILFGPDVSNCAYTATVGGDGGTGANDSETAQANFYAKNTGVNSVIVTTFDAAGKRANEPFSLIVAC